MDLLVTPLTFWNILALRVELRVGMPGAGAITVGERPTRLIVVGLAAAGAAISGAGVPLTGWDWGTVFAVTWTAVGVVAMVQLWLGIRRSIPATYPPDR